MGMFIARCVALLEALFPILISRGITWYRCLVEIPGIERDTWRRYLEVPRKDIPSKEMPKRCLVKRYLAKTAEMSNKAYSNDS